jgi:hypothetical protein
MDVIKISFCPTNQSSVALYHILDDASVKLTLFQPPTVVFYLRDLRPYVFELAIIPVEL